MGRKEEIMAASQFVTAIKEDLDITVKISDVKLGRLKFAFTQKDNGLVCFYIEYDNQGATYIAFIKAFKGKTERIVKTFPKGIANVYQTFIPPCSFPAVLDYTDNQKWHYIAADDDFVILNQEEYQELKNR